MLRINTANQEEKVLLINALMLLNEKNLAILNDPKAFQFSVSIAQHENAIINGMLHSVNMVNNAYTMDERIRFHENSLAERRDLIGRQWLGDEPEKVTKQKFSNSFKEDFTNTDKNI